MNDPLLVSNITSQKNFITEGNVSLVNGTYTVLYNFLTSKNQLNASIGYDVITAGESASNKVAQKENSKFQKIMLGTV